MMSCVKLNRRLFYFEKLDSYLTRCEKLVSKSNSFQKSWYENCLFSISLSNCWFLRKRVAAKVGNLWCKTIQNWLPESRTFIKICFFPNQFHFKIWCVVELFFENWDVLKLSIRNLSSCDKTDLTLTHLNFFNQNVTRCTTNDSKTDYSQNFWSKIFFIKDKKQLFPEQLFRECTKKPTLTFLWCKLTR